MKSERPPNGETSLSKEKFINLEPMGYSDEQQGHDERTYETVTLERRKKSAYIEERTSSKREGQGLDIRPNGNENEIVCLGKKTERQEREIRP
jgi:hypothetical protein